MLEVHPPHHGPHTWRDFFIHIATIVVGLIIAIGLEQTVEFFHHRHLVAQARETLHEEMTENQKLIRHNLETLTQDDARLRHNIAILQQYKDHPSSTQEKLDPQWEWYGTFSTAWSTARDTGALALMPYADVQHYSLVYLQQDIVEQSATSYIRLHNQAFAPALKNPDLDKLSPADLDKLIDGTTLAIIEEKLLRNLAASLDRNYTHALSSR